MTDDACSIAPTTKRLPQPTVDPDRDIDNAQPRQAIFAGGCFWCIEGAFERLAGVLDAVSGYAGGSPATADYRSVCGGDTDHAEVVQVTYDPRQITFGDLLRIFFTIHDPTQRDGQGPDIGRQYRSAVFWVDEAQREATEAYIRQLGESGAFSRPIVTSLERLERFFPAEDYHQDYARLHPEQPYVRQQTQPKLIKLEQLFPERLR